MQPVRNFCMVEVKSGYNELASGIELQDGEALKLPDPAAEGSFNLVWFNYTDYKNPADDPHREIIKVTSITGNFLEVQRGQEGISATTKNAPGRVYRLMLSLTRAAFEELVNGRHGVITGNTFGNGRGTDATDFQFLRSANTQVASGASSFIAAGMNNTAGGECSFASGCGNLSAGQYSHSEGCLNASSSTASHAEGYFCTAGGVASHAEGYQTSALGDNSHAEGFQTSAVGINSHAEGSGAVARLRGEHARASGYISEFGDAQFSSVTLSGVTPDGIQAELFLSPPSERIVLEDNLTAGFYARITAHTSGNAAEAAYIELKGVVSRTAGASSVTLSSCIKTVIWKTVPSWDANFEADTVNGALKVKVTGEAGKTVRWLVILELAKIR
ncbi:MAG: hypothetical protein ACM3QX_14965 [Syntrophomonadaceae bacterium]